MHCAVHLFSIIASFNRTTYKVIDCFVRHIEMCSQTRLKPWFILNTYLHFRSESNPKRKHRTIPHQINRFSLIWNNSNEVESEVCCSSSSNVRVLVIHPSFVLTSFESLHLNMYAARAEIQIYNFNLNFSKLSVN